MPSLPFAANASQGLPPGFSSDNLTRQNSDAGGNALDDFLGRNGWSKMQQQQQQLQQSRNPHLQLIDNQGLPQLQQFQELQQQRLQQQQQQQQQHPQSYSKMMGLMN